MGKAEGRRNKKEKGLRGERVKREEKEKERTLEVNKVAEEWEIWDKDEEAKWLVPERFHK